MFRHINIREYVIVILFEAYFSTKCVYNNILNNI